MATRRSSRRVPTKKASAIPANIVSGFTSLVEGNERIIASMLDCAPSDDLVAKLVGVMTVNTLSAEAVLARFFNDSVLSKYCIDRLNKSGKGKEAVLAARIAREWTRAGVFTPLPAKTNVKSDSKQSPLVKKAKRKLVESAVSPTRSEKKSKTEKKLLKLNTSNAGKLAEFQRLLTSHGYELEKTHVDLDEIDSDPVQVVVHKASSAGAEILIEDTSLDVEGTEVGVNVRWLLGNLDTLAGRKATWRVLLGLLKEDGVHVYEGVTQGTIAVPQGEGGFGFDPIFLPEGETETLAVAKPDRVSARAKAVTAFATGSELGVYPPITNWEGKWQH